MTKEEIRERRVAGGKESGAKEEGNEDAEM